MTLDELINTLRDYHPARATRIGFKRPHSYRGYYDQIAFEPTRKPSTVADLLAVAESAMGKTYTGYKGGDYEMGPYTECNLAFYGCTGEEIGPLLLAAILDDVDGWIARAQP